MRRRIHVAVTLPIHLLDKYIYYIKRHKRQRHYRGGCPKKEILLLI